jgi:V/A-type H+/Na+-transporting ATPase subunit C
MMARTPPRFDYGNARLRARRQARLTSAQVMELAGRDVEGLLGALAETGLRAAAEAALARGGGLRRLHDAIRVHEAGELEALRSYYEGQARELIDVLLSRFELHNLLVLVRGALRDAPAEQVLRDVVPVGAFRGALAAEVAGQQEAATAIDLLVGWRLPDPGIARALARGFEAYERDEDLAKLGHALSAAFWERVAARLDEIGNPAAELRAVLARRIDEVNLLAALRRRAVLAGGETGELPHRLGWLAGGRAAAASLDTGMRLPDAGGTAAALIAAVGGYSRPALERWVADGDIVAVQRALERRRLLDELALFRHADPLGIAVPIAYVAELELEARNLRILAAGAAQLSSPEQLSSQLVLPAGAR